MTFCSGATRVTSKGGWPSATMETQHSSASSLPLRRTVNVPEGTPRKAACATGEDRAIFSVVGLGLLGAFPSSEAGTVWAGEGAALGGLELGADPEGAVVSVAGAGAFVLFSI